MNKAFELFTAVPRLHNCAQAVAAGCGAEQLSDELASAGGGKAPGGRCGALHAAMLLLPEEAEEVRRRFIAEAGSEICLELKREIGYPCSKCVESAAAIVEELKK